MLHPPRRAPCDLWLPYFTHHYPATLWRPPRGCLVCCFFHTHARECVSSPWSRCCSRLRMNPDRLTCTKNVVKRDTVKQTCSSSPLTENTHFLSDTLLLCTGVLCIPLTYLDNEKQKCDIPPRYLTQPCARHCTLLWAGLLPLLRHLF